MVTLDQIKEAQERLARHCCADPLIRYFPPANKQSPRTDMTTAGQLFFKPESLQPIGSFKLRGAYNKIASFTDEQRLAASSRIPAATMRKAWPMRRGPWERRRSS